MSTFEKEVKDSIPIPELLPSILASLGLRKRPNFPRYHDKNKHRIHWAVRVLKYAGYTPVINYDFDHYICGPFSDALEEALEALDWNEVAVAATIDDDRIAAVRHAIKKGDDFLLALSMVVGVADSNKHVPNLSKERIIWTVVNLAPDLADVAEEAYAFAEVNVWAQ